MATTKNLCAQIPIDLHERVSEERERLGQTTSEYIINLIQDYSGPLCWQRYHGAGGCAGGLYRNRHRSHRHLRGAGAGTHPSRTGKGGMIYWAVWQHYLLKQG